MYFSSDNLALTLAQAACVALPGAGLPAWAQRLRAPAWVLVLPLSVVLVIAGIELVPGIVDGLTWLALVLVPPGCALALGWAAHGARAWLAVLAAPLLVLAWVLPGDHAGQAATTLLIAGSAVTLGRLLRGAAPLTLLKLSVIAMAAVDAYLVFSNTLQAPNALLEAASPGSGLPQLQSASFGSVGLGYGDFACAAAVGAILAPARRTQAIAAAAMLVLSLAWDQLFLIYDVLPATIPPAIVLVLFELRPAARSRC